MQETTHVSHNTNAYTKPNPEPNFVYVFNATRPNVATYFIYYSKNNLNTDTITYFIYTYINHHMLGRKQQRYLQIAKFTIICGFCQFDDYFEKFSTEDLRKKNIMLFESLQFLIHDV